MALDRHPVTAGGGVPAGEHVAAYSILGVPVVVHSSLAEPIEIMDRSYGSFRTTEAVGDAIRLEVSWEPATAAPYVVRGSDGQVLRWPSAMQATFDLMDNVIRAVGIRHHEQGNSVVHAGSVVHRGRAVILAGPSGAGKTTLALGLVARGMGLLSDELAAFERDTDRILPHRRELHIRPGTPERVPGLAYLLDRPRKELGGGSQWALYHDEVEERLGAPRSDGARLGAVILLEPRGGRRPQMRSIRPGLATLELMRSTPSASVDFVATLHRIGGVVAGVPCATLRAGELRTTVDRVVAWLEGLDA